MSFLFLLRFLLKNAEDGFGVHFVEPFLFLKVDVVDGDDSDGGDGVDTWLGDGVGVRTNLGKRLQQGTLGIPGNSPLPGTSIETPHVIVGDEAFPLKTYLMRPYPGQNLNDDKRIFNYRLSRARRIVENTFGILTQKFRIYNGRIQANPENVDNIVLATCILHNFIKYFNPNTTHASDYEGSVPWQEDKI
ncbi:unnamed protein product [Pieris macdunnoughi]|uniref:DDE Tnp4 domain-containing protein n=1 Tax=Pieris macdunnoughi TaxID=345717 RepID=A0A821XVT1_9NEOP|nr:unnamed protein product [Pieris macdunnoughi]